MLTRAVIDRIEDNMHAVLLVGEDERELVVPAGQLPADAKAGTWLQIEFDDDELVRVSIDAASTDNSKSRILQKLQRLRQRRNNRFSR